jgi:hypothetical protein
MLSITSIVFTSLTIAIFAALWVFELCGPDGLFAFLRKFWYAKNLQLSKPLFECPLCFAGWASIAFFTATTLEPLTVFIGATWAMFWAKIIQSNYD